MIKVFVENNQRVSKFINTNLDYGEDLLNSNKKEVKEFLNKYHDYIFSNKCDKLKEFYEITGLMLMHECIIDQDNQIRRVVYSMNNRFDSNIDIIYIKKPMYLCHILVQSDEDTNDIKYQKSMYYKNIKDYELGNKIRYDLSCICSNISSKIKTIERVYNKNAFENIKKKDVKQIMYTMLNNLCILLKNGDLYVDNRLYATNVETMWYQDSYTSLIIYKNNSFEFLISEFHSGHRVKHKKIVYNNTIMASLYKNNVHITFLTDLPDKCVMTTFMGVDDIYCTRSSLYLIIGDKKLRIPSWYNTIIV